MMNIMRVASADTLNASGSETGSAADALVGDSVLLSLRNCIIICFVPKYGGYPIRWALDNRPTESRLC